MGTFGKSAHFYASKNDPSGAETKKPRLLFNANIPPKWCRTHLFYAFSTFRWVLLRFWNLVFLRAVSPLKMTKSTWVQKKVPTWEGKVPERKQKQFWNQWSSGNNMAACQNQNFRLHQNKNHPNMILRLKLNASVFWATIDEHRDKPTSLL